MQGLNESRIVAVRKIWDDYVEFEASVLRESKNHLDIARQVISNVDGHKDSQLFIKYNKRRWEEPADFVFESAPVIMDTVSG